MPSSRIFSGIQPSGELHIGNYLGAVKNWVALQQQYESFFCIVDYHAITVPYEPDDLRRRTRDMAISLLASGIDPSACTLFVQSAVPEHTELAWIFNTVTPLGELERQTQFKEKSARQESIARRASSTIPCFRRPTSCCTRRTWCRSARTRFSTSSCRARSRAGGTRAFRPATPFAKRRARLGPDGMPCPRARVFPEPKPLLTPTRRIMGLDGQAKMSKSLGNTVGLLEDPKDIWEKLRPAVTDPEARAADRSGNAGSLQHLPPAQGIQSARDGGSRRRAVPHRRVGLHRLQESAARVDGA